MNKAQLLDAMVAKTGSTRADAERALAAVLDSMRDGLTADGNVSIVGFGTLEVKHRKSRMGVNPRTGERIQLKPSATVKFKPAKALKEMFQPVE